MPSISLQELQDLREIANAATAGPWETGQTTFGDPADGPTHVCVRAQGQPWQEHLAACDGSTQSGRDFAHIAAFDPPTALALIDEIERLRGTLGGAR